MPSWPPAYAYAHCLWATYCLWVLHWWPWSRVFFSTYDFVWSKIRKSLQMHIRQKNWLKYIDCAELKKITITNFYKLFDLFFSVRQVLQILLLLLLFDFEKNEVNSTSILLILFFTSLPHSFKWKIKLFFKEQVVFFGRFHYNNPDVYPRISSRIQSPMDHNLNCFPFKRNASSMLLFFNFAILLLG